MDSTWEYRFYVVELCVNRRAGCDSYVCVPSSWILKVQPQMVRIKYPVEDFNLTKELNESEDKYSGSWTVFDARVIYVTDYYADAQAKIKTLEGRKIQEQIEREIEKVNRSLSSEIEFDQTPYSDVSATKNYYTAAGSEQLHLSLNKGNRERKEQTKSGVMEDAGSRYKNNDVTEPAHKRTCTRCDLLEGKLQQMSALLEKHIRDSAGVESIQMQMMWKLIMLEDLMPIDYRHPTQATASAMHTDAAQFCQLKAKKVPQRRSSAVRSSLPPHRCHVDTKWTRRHRAPAPNLTELMPHKGVYVDRDRLWHCTSLAKNSNTLASLLLPEVFSDEALRTCSVNGSCTVPGLDYAAKFALLKYVKCHAIQHDWPYNESDLVKNIRSRLVAERRKHNRKNEDEKKKIKKKE
ncbi:unnamed protein product, partial [Iphiclides podalirius]